MRWRKKDAGYFPSTYRVVRWIGLKREQDSLRSGDSWTAHVGGRRIRFPSPPSQAAGAGPQRSRRVCMRSIRDDGCSDLVFEGAWRGRGTDQDGGVSPAMKRAVFVTGATAVGVAWLLTYKVTPHSLGVAGALPPSPSSSDNPSASPSPSPTPAGVSGTFTGSDFPNRFGDVVVRLVISDGRITDVQAVQLPNDRQRSAYI